MWDSMLVSLRLTCRALRRPMCLGHPVEENHCLFHVKGTVISVPLDGWSQLPGTEQRHAVSKHSALPRARSDLLWKSWPSQPFHSWFYCVPVGNGEDRGCLTSVVQSSNSFFSSLFLGIEPRAFSTLGKHSSSGLYPQPSVFLKI